MGVQICRKLLENEIAVCSLRTKKKTKTICNANRAYFELMKVPICFISILEFSHR